MWFVRWAESVAGSATIHMGTFEEGLGRIMFVAGALEHERPFLAPLYKFSYNASQGLHSPCTALRGLYLEVFGPRGFIEKALRLRYEDLSSWLHTQS